MSIISFSACQTASTEKPTAEKTAEPEKSQPAEQPKTGEEKPKTSSLKPGDIDPNKPVPAEELNAAFLADEEAWKGKEVTVIGKYHSTTGSKVAGKDRIRVDLADPKTNKRIAGCVVPQKPPEDLAKQRENRVFKGKILENRYGRILIEPCEFVK
ncbi:MAG: hypothetical protein R2747_00765 [Pyrinomonadaceae bacterium]